MWKVKCGMKIKDEKGSVKKRNSLRSLRTENIRNKKSNLPKRQGISLPSLRGGVSRPRAARGRGFNYGHTT